MNTTNPRPRRAGRVFRVSEATDCGSSTGIALRPKEPPLPRGAGERGEFDPASTSFGLSFRARRRAKPNPSRRPLRADRGIYPPHFRARRSAAYSRLRQPLSRSWERGRRPSRGTSETGGGGEGPPVAQRRALQFSRPTKKAGSSAPGSIEPAYSSPRRRKNGKMRDLRRGAVTENRQYSTWSPTCRTAKYTAVGTRRPFRSRPSQYACFLPGSV
jgi:hypothetical protein